MTFNRHFGLLLLLVPFCLCADVLTFERALERALANSPRLKVAEAEVEVKQAEEYQVSLFPNPIASISVGDPEGLVGSNGRSDEQEIQVTLTELIELGGKRGARVRGAACQTDQAGWELESMRLDIYHQVYHGLIEVMAAQEYLKLATEQEHLAQEVHGAIAAKVQAGKAAPLQQSRAGIALAHTTLALEKAKRLFEFSKKKLVSLWDSDEIDFEAVTFPFYDLQPVPELSMLLQKQASSPDLVQWDAQICQAEEAVALERAGAIPDLTVSAGFENERRGGNSWTLGVSLPLPIFDRNQGNICGAEWTLCQLYEKQRQALIQARLDLTQAYEELSMAYQEGSAYQERLLTSAEEAFKGAREGYAQGKYDYFELLDAESTLFEVRERYIEILMEYQMKLADINRLVGLPTEILTCGDDDV